MYKITSFKSKKGNTKIKYETIENYVTELTNNNSADYSLLDSHQKSKNISTAKLTGKKISWSMGQKQQAMQKQLLNC